MKKRALFLFPLSWASWSPLGGLPLETIQPLATRAEAWQAIPGMSNWVLGIIKQGRGLHISQPSNAHVLHAEIICLLVKGAVETVSLAQSESGFFSRYFLVPKKDGGLRPILDLRHLNQTLMKRPFRMITSKQILSQICPGDWFFSIDLKDTYFHIQIAPHHRRFLRFAFEGVAYHGCGSFPAETDGNPHPELPRRLAHFGPVGGRDSISQFHAPQPLRVPRTQGQFWQERTVPQPTNFLPGNSYPAAPSVLAETSSHGRLCVKMNQACVAALAPWKNHLWIVRGVPLGMVYRRKVVSTDASNLGWGVLSDNKPAFGFWSKKEVHLHINCLQMLAVSLGLCIFLSDLRGYHVLVWRWCPT